ncbi:MAG: S8 family serine peptidase [Candidatus Saccharimonadales bacterium]|nr:S8 family serine peptidase [Candidatus Saccharimonadales bacterium]
MSKGVLFRGLALQAIVVLLIVAGMLLLNQSFSNNRLEAAGDNKTYIVTLVNPEVVGPNDEGFTKAGIAALQSQLAGSLSSSSNTDLLHEYENLPMALVSANDDGLGELQSNEFAVAVIEDKTLEPLLTFSIPYIGADVTQAAGWDGSGQAVAVLDTGVETTHEMLTNIISEACYSNGGGLGGGTTLCPNSQPSQTGSGASEACAGGNCDHGSHVASIAVGNSATHEGVANGADLVAMNVFTEYTGALYCGAGPDPCALTLFSDVLLGIDRVITLEDDPTFTTPIASVNMSLGGGAYADLTACQADSAYSAFYSAFAALLSRDIVPVVASGNESSSTEISFPGCVENAFTVGSVNSVDWSSGPDNYFAGDVSPFTNSNALVDIMAPGALIEAAIPGNTYALDLGTSMAAPHVAGAIAVMKQNNPSAPASALLDILANSSTTVLDSRNSITFPELDMVDAMNQTMGRTWDGGGSTNDWSDAANWTNDLLPDLYSQVTFDGTSTKDVNIDVDVDLMTLDFDPAYTGSVTVDGKRTVTALGDVTLPAGASGFANLSLFFDFTASLDAGNTEVDEITVNSGTLTLTSDVTADMVTIVDTLLAGANTITARSFDNQGTFTAGTSTVALTGDGGVSGSSTFNNLTISGKKTTTLEAAATQTISGTLTLTGQNASNRATITSDSAGVQAIIAPGGTVNAQSISVQDLNNTGATITALNSIDLGNNTGWVFPSIITSSPTAAFEGGDAGTYTVELQTEPTDDVDVTLTPDAESSIDVTSICFTNTTNNTPGCVQWDAPQTITVTADDDTDLENAHTTLISYSATSTGDANYDGIPAADTSVKIYDNEELSDNDEDGVIDSIEKDGPNNGDANDDGTVDYIQPNVTTAINNITGGTTTLEISGCTSVDNFSVVEESELASQSTDYDFPLGLNDFTLTCPSAGDTATITVYYDDVEEINEYYKVAGDGSVTDITSQVTIGTDNIGGTAVTTVSYDVTDGGSLDEDGLANGTIEDPAGYGVLAASLADTGTGAIMGILVGLVVAAISLVTTQRTRGRIIQLAAVSSELEFDMRQNLLKMSKMDYHQIKPTVTSRNSRRNLRYRS